MLETGHVIDGIDAITVTAEPIYPDQRATIDRAFASRTYSIYGTREFGMIAAESPLETGLHVNPLNAMVEILLPDGSPAPPGTPGQVVVTDTLNRAMPLIRYRIGDVAAMLPMGKWGLPRLEIVAGRETDFVVSTDGRFISGAALTLISAPGIAQLQYIQSLDGRLTVNYVKTGACTSEGLRELQSKISAVVGEDLPLSLVEVNHIGLLPSGKLQYVRSDLSRQRLAVTYHPGQPPLFTSPVASTAAPAS
jgi:phenylacetate-CoA ligase